MKVAVICTHAGAPGTLATTAFIRALMDGFGSVGVTARAVGLARHDLSWVPESMEPYDTALPWLKFSPTTPRDVIEAGRRGVFGEPCTKLGGPSDWHLELLLERALEEFAGGDDLVVMFYPRVYMMLQTCARICRRRGWRLIIISTEALSDAQIDPSIREQFIDCTVECSDGDWVLSEYLAEYWKARGVPPERIYVKPPPVSVAAFHTPSSARRGSVVYLGNLEHREIDYLLDVSEMVRADVEGYRLYIYGDSSDARRRALLQEIRARDLTHAVSIEKPVAPTSVPDVLATAQVLVLPRSHGEFSQAGFPNKLGEYLASGRPVVVTAVGDIPKVLTDGRNAFLVKPDDPKAFADALRDALTSPGRSERIGAEGRLLAAQSLASSAVARELIDFLDTITPLQAAPSARTWTMSRRALIAGLALPIRALFEGAIRVARVLGLNPSGQYGWMLVKRGIVAVCRFLGLWPKDGIHGRTEAKKATPEE